MMNYTVPFVGVQTYKLNEKVLIIKQHSGLSFLFIYGDFYLDGSAGNGHYAIAIDVVESSHIINWGVWK